MFTKEEWKEYQVRLDVLTPIIINTGEYYDFGELIFSQEGKGKQINLSLLAKYLDKKNINCFVSEIEQRGLKVQSGVASAPPIVNPHFRRRRLPELSVEQYVEAIVAGDITRLSQAVTLVESTLEAHRAKAQAIIEGCLHHAPTKSASCGYYH